MNTWRLYIFFVLGLFLLTTAPVGAYTSTDYYNAGLQFYNAKNYQQAIQYFSAAISLDPNNTAALQGRANCYYVQGQYSQALADYQKVQALQPNPQLASMIQALQAKVGAGSTGSTSLPQAAAPAVSGASFGQGVALYQQGQYAAAIPLFQKATQENPNDANAYYYLGVCQMQAGDMKDAAVALGISNKLKPNPAVAGYVNQLKSRLSPDDQKWVDGQIGAPGTATAAAAGTAVVKPISFGIRSEPAIFLVNLTDFTADAQSLQSYYQQQQSSDPSLIYSASVPTGFFGGALEPVIKFGNNFEIGLPFAFHSVGTVTEAVSDDSGFAGEFSYGISAFSIGLAGRYFLSLDNNLQLFIGGGPLLVPIGIDIQGTTVVPGYLTDFQTGSFSSSAIGGQIQLGLDWHLGNTFVISPFGGYKFASTGSAFTGTLTDDTTYYGSTYIGSYAGQLEVTKTSNGNEIYFLQNGQTPIAATDRPLQLDLGGPFAGIQISAYF